MKKQFDLNYYLAHPETRVETRNGIAVRIVNTDAKSPEGYHVVGLLTGKYDDYESAYRFTAAGEYSKSGKSAFDLFFVLPDPVKKKVPLNYDDLVERVKAGKTMWLVTDGDTVFNIVDFDFVGIYYIQGKIKKIVFMSYGCLLDDELMFADGDPCWKEGGEE